MLHLDPAVLFLCVFAAWMLTASILAGFGRRDGSLCVADRGTTLLFRRRMGVRVYIAMMALLCFFAYPALYWMIVTEAALHHQTASGAADLLLLLMMTVPLGLGMLFFAGPSDLSLDLDRRTYRFVTGWPLFPRVETGSWDDMAGVFVRRYRSNSYVGIAWRKERRAYPRLGLFGREKDAEALADELAARLGLPRVAPPPTGRTSVDPTLATLQKEPELPAVRPFRSALSGTEPTAESGKETR